MVLPQLAFGCASEMMQMADWKGALLRQGNEGIDDGGVASPVEGSNGDSNNGGFKHLSLAFHQFMGSWREVPFTEA